MPDLLSRLSEKLDEVERAAENAKGSRVTTHGAGGLHAALWGPSDVLRLVAAHREVIGMCRSANQAGEEALMTAGEFARSEALDDVIAVIARGYGITEEGLTWPGECPQQRWTTPDSRPEHRCPSASVSAVPLLEPWQPTLWTLRRRQ
jgi:hypothetical protein